MKLLVIGGHGMIGHRLWSTLSHNHEVWGTIRSTRENLALIPNINRENIIENLDVFDELKLKKIMMDLRPEIAFNCVGVVKQKKESSDHFLSIGLNAYFPHKLAKICEQANCRVIQFASDCVFSGAKGHYKDDDESDAKDLYGKTKSLGEIGYRQNVLTLRSSFIGREIKSHGSLIEWFLGQRDKKIKGYTGAIYSGFPTYTMVKIINDHILSRADLSGIYNLSSDPIDKFTLLNMCKDLFKINVFIEADSSVQIDRSLDSSRLRKKLNFAPPQWKEMIQDLLIDADFYSTQK